MFFLTNYPSPREIPSLPCHAANYIFLKKGLLCIYSSIPLVKENVLVDVIKEGLKVAFFVNKRSKDIFFFKKKKVEGKGLQKSFT